MARVGNTWPENLLRHLLHDHQVPGELLGDTAGMAAFAGREAPGGVAMADPTFRRLLELHARIHAGDWTAPGVIADPRLFLDKPIGARPLPLAEHDPPHAGAEG